MMVNRNSFENNKDTFKVWTKTKICCPEEVCDKEICTSIRTTHSTICRKDLTITPIMPKYTIHKTIEDYTIRQLVQDIKTAIKMTESISALANLTSTYSLNNIKIETTRIEGSIGVPILIKCILIKIITEIMTMNNNLFGSMKTTLRETLTIIGDFHIPYTLSYHSL